MLKVEKLAKNRVNDSKTEFVFDGTIYVTEEQIVTIELEDYKLKTPPYDKKIVIIKLSTGDVIESLPTHIRNVGDAVNFLSFHKK